MGSHGIEPKRDWTHFLKIVFVIAGGGFYSYYNHICIKLDKGKKKSVLCIQKTFNAVFKNGFNPVLGSIPRLPIAYYQHNKKICLLSHLDNVFVIKSKISEPYGKVWKQQRIFLGLRICNFGAKYYSNQVDLLKKIKLSTCYKNEIFLKYNIINLNCKKRFFLFNITFILNHTTALF